MPRVTTVQAAHTYGVLDPLVIERRDTKFLGSSLSDGDNIILLPQGGWRDRGGTLDYARARRGLTPVAIDASITSMPNGGTEADLLAFTATTTGAASTTRFVVVEADFGTATLVHMIDVKGILIATTGASGALIAEYWNGAAWATFGTPLKLTTDARSRRFASGAPGHAGVSATKFRIAVDATTAAGAVTIAGLRFFVEGASLADGIVRRFQPEQAAPYQLVLTTGNIDVYENGVWRAAIATPITQAILRQVKLEAKFDTILAFHQTMRPQRITYMDAAGEWSCDDVVFENVPLVDYGGVYTNGVNEVQRIIFYDADPGETFEIILEGQTTGAITFTGDATTGTNIATALEALANVDPGLTVTMNAPFYDVATIEFSGGNNANRNWLTMTANALVANFYPSASTVTNGSPAGEDMISDARGWPAVGRFAQQRLVMAGLKARPTDMLASVTGSPYDLNTGLDSAIAAFSYEIEGSENTVIRDIIVARTVMFLGDAQVAYLANRVLSADEVPEFGVSDAPGLARNLSPVTSNNAVYYVQDGGQTLQVTNFNQLEDNLVADNASVLSAFLIRDPVDLTRRRPTAALDADLLVMANADGSATVVTNMRTQEVSGFAPWSTDGDFVSAEVDHANALWFLVQRSMNGTDELRLELHQPDELLDGAVEFTYGGPTTAVTGLSRFNGRDVWAIANDQLYGPFTVSGGAITLDAAATFVRVGTWPRPSATDTPVSLTEETRSRNPRLKRVNRAEISVHETTSLAIAANDGAAVNLPLRTNADTILDEGPLARPFTGKAEAEGMHGFTDHGTLTVTQTFPGHITVRSATKNIVA